MASSNPTSRWAALLLPQSPSRAVADRLFALIDDDDLYLTESPAVGITLPKVKQPALRAEFLARSVCDVADIAKVERDSRVGVRRALTANAAVRTGWVDDLLVEAASRGDVETVKCAAQAASTVALTACAAGDTCGTAVRFELVRRAEQGALSPAEQIDACRGLPTASWDLQVASSGPYSASGRLVDAVARKGAVAEVCDALPKLAPALLWRTALVRRIDADLAQVYVRYAASLDAAVATARGVNGTAELAFGIRPAGTGGVDDDAVAILAAAESPTLAGLLAPDVALSGTLLDAVLANGDAATMRALAANPSVEWTAEQAEVLAGRATTMAADQAPGATARSGLRDLQAAGQVLHRALPCSDDAVLGLLRAGDTRLFGSWVLGRFGRHPLPGQIAALFTEPGPALVGLSPAQHVNLVHEAYAERLPWADELRATAGPLADLHDVIVRGRADAVVTTVAEALPVLGDDPEAWATFASLASTFPGSAKEAATVALAVSS